ncbi:MAG: glycosyltransferase [Muribaculaceae bacterium]|nr:glycosyltransferase [Muribaculaceae bacterium]
MEKDKIKVTVIVATYNQEDTISRTLDSILVQDIDFNMEIIIGDDASTDSTGDICRNYQERYPDIIRYIRNDINKGVRDNYIDCVLEARGEYIADLAGDDFWIRKDKLKREVAVLDQQKDVVLVCTDWFYFEEDKKILSSPWDNKTYPFTALFNDPKITERLLSHLHPVPVHLCTALYRKNVFEKIYKENTDFFRNREWLMEDFQLVVLMSHEGRFQYLDIPSLGYSVNNKSITGNPDFRKRFDLYYSSLKLTYDLAQRLGISHEKLEDTYRGLLHYITMQAFHGFDKSRMQEVRKLIKERNIKPRIKTAIILGLSRGKAIWETSRKTWQKLKSTR